jgi:hypothetical protein
MTRIVMILLLVAGCSPPPPAPPRRQQLVTYCSSSAECQHNTDGCTFCYNAHCSCTLPAEPAKDAGIDAPGGTTP